MKVSSAIVAVPEARAPARSSRLSEGLLVVLCWGAFYMPTGLLPDNTSAYLVVALSASVVAMGLTLPHRRAVFGLLSLIVCYSLIAPLLSDLFLNDFQWFTGLKNFYYPARIIRSLLLFLWYCQVVRLYRDSRLETLNRHILWIGAPHLLFVLLQFLDLFGTSNMFREMNTYVGNYSFDQGRNYGLMSGVDSSGIAVAILALMQRCKMAGIRGYIGYVALLSLLTITSRTGIVFWFVSVSVLALVGSDRRWKILGDFLPVLAIVTGMFVFLGVLRSVPWMSNVLEPVVNFVDSGEIWTASTHDLVNEAEFSLPWPSLIFGSLIDPTTPTFAGQARYISDSGFIQLITALGWVGTGLTILLLGLIVAESPRGRARGYVLAIVAALLVAGIRGPVFFGRFVFDVVIIWAAWFASDWTREEAR